MGNSYSYPEPPAASHRRASRSAASLPSRQQRVLPFHANPDKYHSLDEVHEALRRAGLESSNLIVAVDFSKSNNGGGRNNTRSLHHLGTDENAYEKAIRIIGRTLPEFDDDGKIPAYGFGDVLTNDIKVFSFLPNNAPLDGLDHVLARYQELAHHVRLAGPTSFAPAIRQATRIVAESRGLYHILLLVADGQINSTGDSDIPSQQEQETIDAIVEASNHALSIIMVGVGEGPWDRMHQFDDWLPQRRFDNFQFVNFTAIAERYGRDQKELEARFALEALMEIPAQYQKIQKLRLLGARNGRAPWVEVVDPPSNPALDRGHHKSSRHHAKAPHLAAQLPAHPCAASSTLPSAPLAEELPIPNCSPLTTSLDSRANGPLAPFHSHHTPSSRYLETPRRPSRFQGLPQATLGPLPAMGSGDQPAACLPRGHKPAPTNAYGTAPQLSNNCSYSTPHPGPALKAQTSVPLPHAHHASYQMVPPTLVAAAPAGYPSGPHDHAAQRERTPYTTECQHCGRHPPSSCPPPPRSPSPPRTTPPTPLAAISTHASQHDPKRPPSPVRDPYDDGHHHHCHSSDRTTQSREYNSFSTAQRPQRSQGSVASVVSDFTATVLRRSSTRSSIRRWWRRWTDQDGIPAHFKCPITREVMEDPVKAADGFTYERAAIEQWLGRPVAKIRSPMGGYSIRSRQVQPDHTLKAAIMDARQRGLIPAA